MNATAALTQFKSVGLVYIENIATDPATLVQDPISRDWRIVRNGTPNGQGVDGKVFPNPYAAALYALTNF